MLVVLIWCIKLVFLKLMLFCMFIGLVMIKLFEYMCICELCIGEFGSFIVSRVFIWECIELVVFLMYLRVCLFVMCILLLKWFLMLWRVMCWLIWGWVLCIMIMCMFKLLSRVMLWIILGKLGCLMVLLLNINMKIFFWWVLI